MKNLYDDAPLYADNTFESYREVVKKADREYPAFVGEQEYNFDGSNWTKK